MERYRLIAPHLAGADFVVMSGYGYAGATNDAHLRRCTEAILVAAWLETKLHP